MNTLKRSAITLALVVLAATAIVLAFTSSHDVYGIGWGSSSGSQVGAYSHANIGSQVPSESPFVQTKVDNFPGVTRQCTSGYSYSGAWCAGNSGGYTNPTADATQKAASNPTCGYIDATAVYFLTGIQVLSSTRSVYVPCDRADECRLGGDYWDAARQRCNPAMGADPIVIDTTLGHNTRESYKLTTFEHGVAFDFNADGSPEPAAWVKNGKQVALLALDVNGNGNIDDGSELIGNATGLGNGFRVLQALEALPENGNNDGHLDDRDPLFAKLLLWNDLNEDGVSQANELSPANAYLEAIGLGYVQTDKTDKNGNRFLYEGWARLRGPGSPDSREFTIYDVKFPQVPSTK